jgi:hypothetical protein
MKSILTAAAIVAAIGVAIAHAADSTNPTDSRRDIKVVVSEMANSLIRGIILGANVGPYPSGLVPAHIKSRMMASGYSSASSADSNSVTDE